MGYGTGAYGTGAYGVDSLVSTTYLVQAEAIANRVVRVTVSQVPTAVDNTNLGDALCPGTWKVTREDTGEQIAVIDVTPFDANVFDLTLLEPMGAVTVTHEVDVSQLLDAQGTPIAVPNTLDFPGAFYVNDADDTARQAARGIYGVDIANPPFLVNGGGVGGTLQINAGGDYANETGADLVKKLIIRRITTTKGAFFHLSEYGYGIQPKTLFQPAQLPANQEALRQQVLMEREVEKADVLLSSGDGYGIVKIAAKIKGVPQPIQFQIQVPLS